MAVGTGVVMTSRMATRGLVAPVDPAPLRAVAYGQVSAAAGRPVSCEIVRYRLSNASKGGRSPVANLVLSRGRRIDVLRAASSSTSPGSAVHLFRRGRQNVRSSGG